MAKELLKLAELFNPELCCPPVTEICCEPPCLISADVFVFNPTPYIPPIPPSCPAPNNAIATIIIPNPLVVQLTYASSPVYCNAGKATLEVNGGFPNAVSYLWNTGETTQIISLLLPEVYTVIVTDLVTGVTGTASFDATSLINLC